MAKKRIPARKPPKPLKTAEAAATGAAAGAAGGAASKAAQIANQTTMGRQSLGQLLDDRFLSRQARSLAGGDRFWYNTALRRASEHRNQWIREAAKGGDDVIGLKNKHVTSDNRAEVRKGSKASGITINNKLVRQGRVAAGRKAFLKGAAKGIAKAGLRAAGPVGAAATLADVILANAGQPGAEAGKGTSSKSTGLNARSVQKAKKPGKGR